MLKREITYEDFNGNTVTDTFYFNLTKSEIIEMQVDREGGLEAGIQRIIEAKNDRALIQEFKNIVLMSYGIKSEDGKRFVKNDKIREEFASSAAYDALFMELATNEDSAAMFITGIVPRDIGAQIQESSEVIKQVQENKGLLGVPPPPPIRE